LSQYRRSASFRYSCKSPFHRIGCNSVTGRSTLSARCMPPSSIIFTLAKQSMTTSLARKQKRYTLFSFGHMAKPLLHPRDWVGENPRRARCSTGVILLIMQNRTFLAYRSSTRRRAAWAAGGQGVVGLGSPTDPRPPQRAFEHRSRTEPAGILRRRRRYLAVQSRSPWNP